MTRLLFALAGAVGAFALVVLIYRLRTSAVWERHKELTLLVLVCAVGALFGLELATYAGAGP